MSNIGRNNAEGICDLLLAVHRKLSAKCIGLQNLLQSIAPDAVQNVTPEALQRLSDKLSELMGEDVVRTAFSGESLGGEMVNEQGLSVVDVGEASNANGNRQPISLKEEPPLVPLSSLSPSERERQKRERDRILDELEIEEEMEQRKIDQQEKEERAREMEKRKESAKAELDRLKMAKESQKKMGKALLRSFEESREESTDEAPVVKQEVEQESTDTPKKSVTFADEPSALNESSNPAPASEVDWGDLLQGKLRASGRPTLLNTNDEHLMKKHIVERMPGSSQQRTSLKPQVQTVDSDDESEPAHSPPSSDSEDENTADKELEDDEFDMDLALHHREIALAYHEKRTKIGEDAAHALTSHTHEPAEDPTFDGTSFSQKPKSSISKFRAGRLASSYAASSPSTSQSIGGSVIPASGAETLQRAIRMGKIDSDGQLAGGDAGESGGSEDENEAVQEVLELLKKGEVYNVGPEGDRVLHTVPPGGTASSSTPSQPPPFTMPSEPLPTKPKTSKFKLSRAQAGPPQSSESPTLSGHSTPISTVERSSPKLSSTAVVERSVPTPQSSLKTTVTPPSMIVESPSFARPGQPQAPMIVESPSFPSTAPRTSRPERPPVIMSSTVKESTRSNSSVSSSQPEKEGSTRVSRFRAERM
ncbi:hypothetical protein VNI00_003095 [Paramarasmius palmivorus]|uniref:DUF3835 domain-containing protein n=1 Tax=Paramarasmius palmivorus TaxID=297713 RepID=A0AAW0DVH8_9AGAR